MVFFNYLSEVSVIGIALCPVAFGKRQVLIFRLATFERGRIWLYPAGARLCCPHKAHLPFASLTT
jgi:hypothetical protein